MMQTSGVLIHLGAGEPAMALGARLAAHAGLVLGEPNGKAWPAVLEAADGRASAAKLREIEATVGVVRVDVVFVGTDPAVESPGCPDPKRSIQQTNNGAKA